MKIFGLTISRTKAAQPMPVSPNRGGWLRVFESFTGAWQHNVTVDKNSVLTHSTVYAVMTLIASDIAKLCVDLKQEDSDGIWGDVGVSPFWPVLRKPNRYQNRIQFWESWVLSKLSNGNTYVLKERDQRGIVKALYVLDPCRVKPLVTDDGTVYYQLSRDNMAGLTEDPIVPATEIIHDRFNCLFHPLIGTSPIVACGTAAMQGIAIQNNQTWFFNNRSMPSGFLTAPGAISTDTATRLKDQWDTNYSGENTGKVAVLGDGLKFESMVMNSVDAQLIEQLKWTSETICSVFHVPGYKVGIGAIPSGASVQSLNLEYYAQALQRLIEDAELCLDEGLALPPDMGCEFDIDNLLRMDTVSMVNAEKEAVGAGIKAPNEARKRMNLPPVKGGDSPYLQQQNFSLEALAKRDALEDPFANKPQSKPTEIPQPTPLALPPPDKAFDPDRVAKALEAALAA